MTFINVEFCLILHKLTGCVYTLVTRLNLFVVHVPVSYECDLNICKKILRIKIILLARVVLSTGLKCFCAKRINL